MLFKQIESFLPQLHSCVGVVPFQILPLGQEPCRCMHMQIHIVGFPLVKRKEKELKDSIVHFIQTNTSSYASWTRLNCHWIQLSQDPDQGSALSTEITELGEMFQLCTDTDPYIRQTKDEKEWLVDAKNGSGSALVG